MHALTFTRHSTLLLECDILSTGWRSKFSIKDMPFDVAVWLIKNISMYRKFYYERVKKDNVIQLFPNRDKMESIWITIQKIHATYCI